MISLQNLPIDSKTYIFWNTFKSFCPKCIFWWMFEPISRDLYCLHVSGGGGGGGATGSVQLAYLSTCVPKCPPVAHLNQYWPLSSTSIDSEYTRWQLNWDHFPSGTWQHSLPDEISIWYRMTLTHWSQHKCKTGWMTTFSGTYSWQYL